MLSEIWHFGHYRPFPQVPPRVTMTFFDIVQYRPALHNFVQHCSDCSALSDITPMNCSTSFDTLWHCPTLYL